MDFWRVALSRPTFVSLSLPFGPSRLAALRLPVGGQPFLPTRSPLLRPLLTSRSVFRRRPFGREARPPQVKAAVLRHATGRFTAPSFGHESFAARCPLALVVTASHLLSVRRPVTSFPASFPRLGHPAAVAVPFVRCGQLTVGLSPPGQRPCWAHTSPRSAFALSALSFQERVLATGRSRGTRRWWW